MRRGINLAVVLRRRRSELGLTLKQVADAVGVSEATVQRWEAGTMSIRYDRIVKLAEVLHVNPQEFFGWHVDVNAVNEALLKAIEEDENTVLESYRSLSDEGKEYVKKQIEIAAAVYPKKYYEEAEV